MIWRGPDAAQTTVSNGYELYNVIHNCKYVDIDYFEEN